MSYGSKLLLYLAKFLAMAARVYSPLGLAKPFSDDPESLRVAWEFEPLETFSSSISFN